MRYQALWDLQADALYGKLGDDLPVWMSTLEEIKHARKTFDTSETYKDFGPVRIEFGKVQDKRFKPFCVHCTCIAKSHFVF